MVHVLDISPSFGESTSDVCTSQITLPLTINMYRVHVYLSKLNIKYQYVT